MEHDSGMQGLEAILISLAISGAIIGTIILIAALLGSRHPPARLFFYPLNVLVLIGQVVDGVTTWVGVSNPFGLRLPPFRETVYVSNLIIEAFGGLVYLILKLALGVFVVLALGAAMQMAKEPKEKTITLLVQLTLVVIGAIPVWNNVSNFLAVA